MRHSLAPLLRATVGTVALAVLWAPSAPAAAAPPAPEAPGITFGRRYHAVQHGGIVRAANVSITCRTTPGAPSCSAAQSGGRGKNGDFDMFYVDVDDDPNTYNSSQAEVRLPAGARVTYARLYWGGNLRVGEQKPPEDNNRVLIAEPGGKYKELLADTVVGHRVADGADAFQASADVTKLVRESGSGLYTVAQVNVAAGKSAAGAWGGWTLVVAYENPAEPLRDIAIWDGFAPLKSRGPQEMRLDNPRFPANAGGIAGFVAYNGDRGTTGDSFTLTVGQDRPVALSNSANPANDVLNSTIGDLPSAPSTRVPSYAHTLGYDSDVFDLTGRLPRTGDRMVLRLSSQQDTAWTGVFFAAVDTQR
ncbi:hypothetical protein STXM2123_5469 [Streptomyces sp. F-3]|uniref:DUF3344 domain-containing protein n=1 Tax=Streptomyces thermogriseus TaxID=75292 RepID=A0ABP4DMM3_9ACTN|nr:MULTISPECIES: DUF3344 domain-containing protein [Streptomyces]MDN5384722.1 DUF3344 domain-containing protein [Streptomyces sp. LB8]GAT84768.1 hypothetical protein STXM2123_5469 [Streptomyces sp. F-3]